MYEIVYEFIHKHFGHSQFRNCVEIGRSGCCEAASVQADTSLGSA